MTSFTQNSLLFNFITFSELTKTPQNFVQGSFSQKSTKVCCKNRGEVFDSGHFNVNIKTKNVVITFAATAFLARFPREAFTAFTPSEVGILGYSDLTSKVT